MNVFSALQSKSIRARFFFTLIANILRFALSFLSGMFVARAFGPGDFGNFNFLLTSFLTITSLLDMGTSSAFYTFISRRKRGKDFYIYYTVWVALQFIVALLLATVLLPEFLREKIWLGHGTGIVVLSLFASFSMNQLWQVAGQAGESIRETVKVQGLNVGLSAVYLLAVLMAIRLKALTPANLFVITAVIYIAFSALLVRRLKSLLVEPHAVKESLRSVFEEFKAYCYPFVLYVWVGFLYTFADNWLLQRFGGAQEQGFYQIGYRFTFLSSIATASMLQVFWKETAEAMERGDHTAVGDLFRKVSRLLYFISAVLSCFLIPFSRDILLWLVGPSYEKAWQALSIMLLFPLIQAVGQVASAVLLAGGHTAIYRNLGVAYMFLSIPAAYFVFAPRAGAYFGIPGLGLGATGLALKLVVLNYIFTNIMVYITSRLNGWKFDFRYQPVVLVLLVPAAFVSKSAAAWLLSAVLETVSIPTLLTAAAFLYLALAGAVVYGLPTLTGFERKDMRAFFERAKSLLR